MRGASPAAEEETSSFFFFPSFGSKVDVEIVSLREINHRLQARRPAGTTSGTDEHDFV